MQAERIQIKNDIISNVFGNFDENIKKIENSFSIKIINRGDDILISGDEESIKKAENVLNSLIDAAGKGELIDEQKLNYIINEVDNNNLDEINKLSDDFICMTISGRPLKPKTLGQKIFKSYCNNNSRTKYRALRTS